MDLAHQLDDLKRTIAYLQAATPDEWTRAQLADLELRLISLEALLRAVVARHPLPPGDA